MERVAARRTRVGRPVLAGYRLPVHPSTKPHLAHPNHVFHIGDEPWATRFQQKDAVSLLDPTPAHRHRAGADP